MISDSASALRQATALLESSPLRFPVDLSKGAADEAEEGQAPVVTQLEKELELAVQREQSAGSAATNKERRNYATLNNGVYYWSLPSTILDYLQKTDPTLGEKAVQAQQAYARFKTYGDPSSSPADVETVILFGSRLQDVFYSVENSPLFVEEHRIVLKDLLESTVALYKEAHDLGIMAHSSNATLGKILFSWAAVLGDLARLAGSRGAGAREEQLEYAVASCLKYSGVVSMQEDNVQALNNWGLVICDLANYYGNDGATSTRKQLYRLAMTRFRQALRRSQDSGVDRKVLARCSYNMGSVMYQYCSISDAEGRKAVGEMGAAGQAEGDVHVAYAAQYVMLAYALNPTSAVFEKAIKTVKPFLPLPFLRFSKLVFVYDETNESDDQMQQWRPRSLALDAYHLKTAEVHSSEVTDLKISVQDITSCSICVDPWIPGGIGLKLRYRGSKHGVYLSSTSREDLQGLLDALNMLQVCSSSGLQALADALQRM